MKVYRHTDEMSTVSRAHPWGHALSDPSQRYHDFKLYPDRIPEVLEDFVAWNSDPAILAFYELLRSINGPASEFESNDCAFRDPQPNTDPNYSKARWCNGRLMILFRNLTLNLSKTAVSWLEEGVNVYLSHLDPEFEWGVVGTTIMKSKYVELPEEPDGYQLMLSFFAWGDSDGETLSNLGRLFANLSNCLALLSRDTTARRYEGFIRAEETG